MTGRRRLLRLRAWSALVAFVGGLMLVCVSGHPLGDDAACGESGFSHSSSRTQVGAPVATSAPQHCFLCHWQRSVAGAGTSSPITAVLADLPRSFGLPENTGFVRAECIVRQPARAPPSLVLA